MPDITDAQEKLETKVQKLCRLVNEKFNIRMDPLTFKRTYAGHWARASGSVMWGTYTLDKTGEVCSYTSVTELLKAWPAIEIHPESGNSLGVILWKSEDCAARYTAAAKA